MSVNKVILVGNLGKNAEIKTTPSGLSITKFSLATSEKYKDKNGEWKNNSTWHDCIIFGKLGESLVDYLQQGSMIYLEGKISKNSYEDRQGNKQYSVSIIVDKINLIKTNANAKPSDPKPKKKVDPKFDDESLDNPAVLDEYSDIIPF
jgi:single-strand DNA-binding protein